MPVEELPATKSKNRPRITPEAFGLVEREGANPGSALDTASVEHKRAVEHLAMARAAAQHKDSSRKVAVVQAEAVATAETEVRRTLRVLEEVFYKTTGANLYVFTARFDTALRATPDRVRPLALRRPLL